MFWGGGGGGGVCRLKEKDQNLNGCLDGRKVFGIQCAALSWLIFIFRNPEEIPWAEAGAD